MALDSVDPDIHDRNRGRAGVHAAAVRAIRLLDEARRRHGARMFINAAAVVADFNLHQLPELAAWACDNGADNLLLQPVMPPFWSSHDRAWLMRSELWPQDLDTVNRVVDALAAIKRSGGPIDNAVEQLEGMRDYFSWAPPAGHRPVVDDPFADVPTALPELDVADAELPTLEALASRESDTDDWGREYLQGAPDPGEIGAKRLLATLDPSLDAPGVDERVERIDRCEIGRKSLNINHRGDVRICHDMPPIGDLTRGGLYDIWTSPPADRVRDLIAHCHEGCYLLNCNYCD